MYYQKKLKKKAKKLKEKNPLMTIFLDLVDVFGLV